jgi:hypothetical protein
MTTGRHASQRMEGKNSTQSNLQISEYQISLLMQGSTRKTLNETKVIGLKRTNQPTLSKVAPTCYHNASKTFLRLLMMSAAYQRHYQNPSSHLPLVGVVLCMSTFGDVRQLSLQLPDLALQVRHLGARAFKLGARAFQQGHLLLLGALQGPLEALEAALLGPGGSGGVEQLGACLEERAERVSACEGRCWHRGSRRCSS